MTAQTRQIIVEVLEGHQMVTSDDAVFLSFTFVIALSLTLAVGLWGRLIATGDRPSLSPPRSKLLRLRR